MNNIEKFKLERKLFSYHKYYIGTINKKNDFNIMTFENYVGLLRLSFQNKNLKLINDGLIYRPYESIGICEANGKMKSIESCLFAIVLSNNYPHDLFDEQNDVVIQSKMYSINNYWWNIADNEPRDNFLYSLSQNKSDLGLLLVLKMLKELIINKFTECNSKGLLKSLVELYSKNWISSNDFKTALKALNLKKKSNSVISIIFDKIFKNNHVKTIDLDKIINDEITRITNLIQQ